MSVGLLAAYSIFELMTQVDRETKFEACYILDGKRFLLRDGQVLLGNEKVGSFRLERGDASKGPNRIMVTSLRPDLLPPTIDTNRVWYPGSDGLLLQLENGTNYLARKCPTR